MSLSVNLYMKKWISYDEGRTFTEDHDEVYWANITHNLGDMARAAGIYYALWRPEEKEYKQAKDIIPLLTNGLKDLKERPEHFKKFDSPNGWGLYKHFVPFVEEYLNACIVNPDSFIEVDR